MLAATQSAQTPARHSGTGQHTSPNSTAEDPASTIRNQAVNSRLKTRKQQKTGTCRSPPPRWTGPGLACDGSTRPRSGVCSTTGPPELPYVRGSRQPIATLRPRFVTNLTVSGQRLSGMSPVTSGTSSRRCGSSTTPTTAPRFSVGVGKTHPACVPGHIAVHRRRTVRTAPADKLFKRLKAARLDNTWKPRCAASPGSSCS